MKNTILIIGNQGYVGSVLSKFLKENKLNKVIGLDSGIFSKILISKNPDKLIDKQIKHDVRSFKNKYLENVDAVIYLAAISNDPMGNKFKKLTMDVNLKSCIKIAKMAKKKGVKKFIFASSCSVYGKSKNNSRVESDSVDPLTTYAKTKVIGEKKLKKISSKDFQVFCLRFATACGHSPRLRLDLVLNDFIANAFIFRNIKLLSNGKAWRPLISVNNMSKIMKYFAEGKNKKLSKSFYIINCGLNNWNYTILDLAKKVASVIKNVSISVGKDKTSDNRSYKVNFGLLKRLTPGLKLETKIENTIFELYKSVKKIKFKNKDFRNSKFIRLKVLKKYMQKN